MARKRFGQHFLTDAGIIAGIVECIDPRPGEALVEIGPGTGALTWPLLAQCRELDVIELDRDLVARLEARPPGDGSILRVHAGDVLGFDFMALARGRQLRVVGNLPYNISTPLLFHLQSQREAIADMVFMVQHEVAARLCAAPGTRAWGRLGVMFALDFQTEYCFTVPPEAFNPPPRVNSAIIRIRPLGTPLAGADRSMLTRLVSAAFNQRRKTLRNALAGLAGPECLLAAGIDPSLRAETLAAADFVRLADCIVEAGDPVQKLT